MVIDGHCHAGQGDILTAPWNTDAPLRAYLRRARAAGIDRTVVFPAFHSDYAIANDALARIVERDPGRLIGFAFVHCKRDAGRIDEMIDRAVRQHGFRGVKVHGSDGMPTRELCEAVRRFRIPLLVDVVGRAYVVDMLAGAYPDVDFIVPHLGSFADDWRTQQAVVDQLVRHPRVYSDTSGVRRFDYLIEVVRRAGAHKLIFGSDGPWLHPGVELHKIRLLGMMPSDEAKVLGGNMMRLLRSRRLPQTRSVSLPAPRSPAGSPLRRSPVPLLSGHAP
jgi:predicted TIM-barrel fold metal-dependent hydrolase